MVRQLRRSVATMVAATAAACALAAPAAAYEPRAPAGFYGISASEIFWASRSGQASRVEAHLDRLQATGVDWVRTAIEWGDFEPLLPVGNIHTYYWGSLDRYVEGLARHDLTLMPMPRGVPLWAADLDGVLSGCGSRGAVAPAHFGNYGHFAGALVARYGRNGSFWAANPEVPYRPVTSVELWNEPNWASYWCPTPDPEAYAGLVSAGAVGVHSADPEATAALGGLVTVKESTYANGRLQALETGEFVRRMMATIPALAGEIDAVALHAYDPDPEMNLRMLGWARSKLDAAGLEDAELLLTEFGWHTGTAPGSVTEQARHDNFRYLLNRLPRTDCGLAGIAPHAWFTDEQDPNDPEDWWGMVNPHTAEPHLTAMAYWTELSLFRGQGAEPAPRETIRLCGRELPDMDGDGVPDEDDDYPTDPTRSTGSGEKAIAAPPAEPRIHPARVDDSFFGVSTPEMPHQAETRRAHYDSMSAARIGTSRDHFFWGNLEPVPPSDPQHGLLWSQSDPRVLGLASRGIRLLPTFGRQPGWAGAAAGPADSALAAFLREFAGRYGRGGSFWHENRDLDPALAPTEYEVWADANLDSSAWDGSASAAEHADTYLAARAALRGVDPQAKAVVGLAQAGVEGGAADFIRGMVQARPQLQGAIDGVYVRIVQARSIAQLEDVVRTIREALDATGNPSAALRVGFGWSTIGPGAISETQRASLVTEAASRLARGDCGVDGVLAYAWATAQADAGNLWDWFGLADLADGSLNPGGRAYRDTIARYLGYAEAGAPRAAVHPCSREAPDTDRDGVADAAEDHPLDPARATATAQPPAAPSFSATPGGATQETWAAFRFSAPGAVEYQCRLDGAPYRSCGSSGEQTYHAQSEGAHTFRVRAVDSLGLVGPAREHTWTVDREPPDTALVLAGGGNVVHGNRARLQVSSNEQGASFWCQWAEEAWQPCPQPLELDLPPGERTVYAVAVDPAGNVDPSAARLDFEVRDALATPEITWPSAAAAVGPLPEVRFETSEPGTPECRFDAASFAPCSAAAGHVPAQPLPGGPHTFQVRVVGAGGATSAAARVAFTVDADAPHVSFLKVPKRISDRTPTLRFVASDASSVDALRCSVDRFRWRACGSPFTTRRLRLGRHVIRVTAADEHRNQAATTRARFRVIRR